MSTTPHSRWYKHYNGHVSEHQISQHDRPVVVIDPEDAEQVDQLRRSLARLEFSGASLADMLREFAAPTPPKPAEPQGLGAVALGSSEHLDCRDNRRWVRSHPEPRPWTSPGVSGTFHWDDLIIVRVLSEGVTP
jgi:hypothetical protein